MESLDGTDWDVLIAGTGLKQSLLALSLSRAGKKLLHIDSNNYYGANQAALSLSEAEAWTERHAASNDSAQSCTFSDARIKRSAPEQALGASRAYSLALAPELVFTRSNLLPALVSSHVHDQLEFHAVSDWFVKEYVDNRATLFKVPNGREDIFQDGSIDLRTKRAMMKFIRFITDTDKREALTSDELALPLPDFLKGTFGVGEQSQAPILTLTLSTEAPCDTTVAQALPNVVRHLTSIGLFGPGFNALVPKWGGLAEITQVACRAGAVGGGVYVLNKSVESIDTTSEQALRIKLSDGDTVTTKCFTASPDQMPRDHSRTSHTAWSRSISIVGAPLNQLFPSTSEGGVTPAGAVIRTTSAGQPIYIFVHSADTGECPSGQCVVYASIACGIDQGRSQLEAAVRTVLSTDVIASGKLLWSLSYQQNELQLPKPVDSRIIYQHDHLGLALNDVILDEVESIWHEITNDPNDDFMKFEARTGMDNEEDENIS